jgi:glutamine amidotransferase
MGWNRIQMKTPHPVFAGINESDEFYFVHGFFPQPADPAQVLAITDYGIEFSSVIGKGNLVATQFHPEKSGRPGLTVLKNFSRWQPC